METDSPGQETIEASTADNGTSLQELVTYMAKTVVSDPDSVVVEELMGHRVISLKLTVAPDDMGRVIGRGGRVANAMRTLLRVTASTRGKRATLDIVPKES